VKHEAFYAATATVVPVLYLAFALEYRGLAKMKLSNWAWFARFFGVIFYGAVFVAIEVVSLLILSGSIRDTDGWRSEVVLWTGTFASLLVLFSMASVLADFVSRER
jgi:hypothetical protein